MDNEIYPMVKLGLSFSKEGEVEHKTSTICSFVVEIQNSLIACFTEKKESFKFITNPMVSVFLRENKDDVQRVLLNICLQKGECRGYLKEYSVFFDSLTFNTEEKEYLEIQIKYSSFAESIVDWSYIKTLKPSFKNDYLYFFVKLLKNNYLGARLVKDAKKLSQLYHILSKECDYRDGFGSRGDTGTYPVYYKKELLGVFRSEILRSGVLTESFNSDFSKESRYYVACLIEYYRGNVDAYINE